MENDPQLPLTVLVVDDDPELVKVMGTMLKLRGFDIV